MPNIIEITELNTGGAEVYARLTEGGGAKCGLFIAEGLKVIGCALDAGCEPVSLLMERRHICGKAQAIIARCGAAPVYTGDDGLLAELTGFKLSRGVLCAMRRPPQGRFEELCADARRVVVLERVSDPTNLGSIFRSAAALGFDAVLLTEDCGDPLYRRAARVSMGTVFQVPWAFAESSGRLPCGLERLRELGFKTAAMALSPQAVSLDSPELIEAEKLAVVLGSEGEGLSLKTVAACDFTVMIPMSRGVDSLNVAAAAAIALWQLRARD